MGQKTNASIFRLGLKTSEWKYKYIEKNTEESSIFLYKNLEIENYINNIFKLYGLITHDCKIEYTQTDANVFISYYESKQYTAKIYSEDATETNNPKNSKELIAFLISTVLTVGLNLYIKNKTINIKTQDLGKKFENLLQKNKLYKSEYFKTIKQFKRFLKSPDQKDLIKILFISVSEHNSAKLLAESISVYINKNKKRHNFLLFVLKKALTELITLRLSKVQGIKIAITGRFNGVPRAKKKLLKIGRIPLQSFDSSISYYNSTSFTPNGTFGIKVWICEKSI